MRLRLKLKLRNREGIVKCARFTYNERTKAYAKEAGLKTDLDHPALGVFQARIYHAGSKRVRL